jgi:hypothetical protein
MPDVEFGNSLSREGRPFSILEKIASFVRKHVMPKGWSRDGRGMVGLVDLYEVSYSTIQLNNGTYNLHPINPSLQHPILLNNYHPWRVDMWM